MNESRFVDLTVCGELIGAGPGTSALLTGDAGTAGTPAAAGGFVTE